MSMQQIIQKVRSFDGALELAPETGSEHPEIAWDDHFFYYSPDGAVPQNTQPYATIVTKDYPDDALSRLDDDNRWRLNIHVGKAAFTQLIGESPTDFAARDFSETDVIMPHPVYGPLGWVAIVNPGDNTTEVALGLLKDAHENERRRIERRTR